MGKHPMHAGSPAGYVAIMPRRSREERPPPPSRIYLVEHYWPGTTAERCRATAELVRTTAEAMARGGTPIRWLHSIIVPADEAAFCVFDAGSLDLVEQVYARAGVRFDRIVDALEV
jgi:hypothetical protein